MSSSCLQCSSWAPPSASAPASLLSTSRTSFVNPINISWRRPSPPLCALVHTGDTQHILTGERTRSSGSSSSPPDWGPRCSWPGFPSVGTPGTTQTALSPSVWRYLQLQSELEKSFEIGISGKRSLRKRLLFYGCSISYKQLCKVVSH